MIWEALREEEFEEAIEKSGGLCVIPLGCLEKHRQHLPVGTDVYIAESVVEEAARLEDVVILHAGPWLGEVSTFHQDADPAAVHRRGCIGIKQETILRVLEELCDEVARNGFRKVLILSSHGGNVAMLDHFLRCQTYEEKNYATMWAWAVDDDLTVPEALLHQIRSRREEFPMITEVDMEVLEGWLPTGYGGGHADFREAALVMADHPELVAQDRYDAEDGRHNPRADDLLQEGLRLANSWYASSPNCYSGLPPYGCSIGIGQAMKKINAERLARIFKRIKENEDCIRIADMLPPKE